MEDEDYCYRPESEIEADSDHEDQDAESELGQWLGQLETLKMVSGTNMFAPPKNTLKYTMIVFLNQ